MLKKSFEMSITCSEHCIVADESYFEQVNGIINMYVVFFFQEQKLQLKINSSNIDLNSG